MIETLVAGNKFRWAGLALLGAALGGGSVWSWQTGSAERLGLLWTVIAGALPVVSPVVWWVAAGWRRQQDFGDEIGVVEGSAYRRTREADRTRTMPWPAPVHWSATGSAEATITAWPADPGDPRGRRVIVVNEMGRGITAPGMRLVLDVLDRRRPQAAIVAVVMELAADPERPNAWLLTVGGVRQSYVDLEDPSLLRFEYARFVGMVLDGLPAGEVDVLHVGGGALTLARYVAHTRAGSRQVVLEPDGELVELVTDRLGSVPGLDVRVCDGRSGVAQCGSGSFDVVLLDAFAVDTIPAELTTAEFVEDVARVLRPGGCFVANLVDGPPLALVRRVAADTARELPHILLLGDKTVLGGRVSGHVILVACRDPEPVAEVREFLARQNDARLRWAGVS